MQSCPPERKDPASSTRTQALVPSTRKLTQPIEPTLAPGGTTNLQPVKRTPQTQYVKQNEKIEKHTASEGKR